MPQGIVPAADHSDRPAPASESDVVATLEPHPLFPPGFLNGWLAKLIETRNGLDGNQLPGATEDGGNLSAEQRSNLARPLEMLQGVIDELKALKRLEFRNGHVSPRPKRSWEDDGTDENPLREHEDDEGMESVRPAKKRKTQAPEEKKSALNKKATPNKKAKTTAAAANRPLPRLPNEIWLNILKHHLNEQAEAFAIIPNPEAETLGPRELVAGWWNYTRPRYEVDRLQDVALVNKTFYELSASALHTQVHYHVQQREREDAQREAHLQEEQAQRQRAASAAKKTSSAKAAAKKSRADQRTTKKPTSMPSRKSARNEKRNAKKS